jgi:hypothetical protein
MLKFKIPPFYHLRGNEHQSPLDRLYALVEPKPKSVSNVYISKRDAKQLRELLQQWIWNKSPRYTRNKVAEVTANTWFGYGPNETRDDVPEGFLLIVE